MKKLTRQIPDINGMQPVQSLLGVNVEDIRAGTSHLLILTSENQLFGWGSNADDRCGLGKQKVLSETPKLIDFAGQNLKIKRLFCGVNNSVIIDNFGLFYSAGSNKNNKSGLVGSTNGFKKSFSGYKLPEGFKMFLGAQNTVIQIDNCEFCIVGASTNGNYVEVQLKFEIRDLALTNSQILMVSDDSLIGVDSSKVESKILDVEKHGRVLMSKKANVEYFNKLVCFRNTVAVVMDTEV